MVLLHDRIAERRLDAPESEDDAAFDAEVLLDAREQRCVSLGAILPSLDAPVGDAAIDVLPELLVELGLATDLCEDAGVGLQAAHHTRIGRVRNAARKRTWAEGLDPLRKWLSGGLRQCWAIKRKRSRAD